MGETERERDSKKAGKPESKRFGDATTTFSTTQRRRQRDVWCRRRRRRLKVNYIGFTIQFSFTLAFSV